MFRLIGLQSNDIVVKQSRVRAGFAVPMLRPLDRGFVVRNRVVKRYDSSSFDRTLVEFPARKFQTTRS